MHIIYYIIKPSAAVWLIACLFVVALIGACSKKKEDVPAGILSEKQMVAILADVYLAQAASTLYLPSDTMRYGIREFMPYIFQLHNITSAQYDSSIAFYARRPEIFSIIYDSVITELSKRQGAFSAR